MVLHFETFGAFGLDSVVGNSFGTFIVCEDVGWRLRIAEIFENIAEARSMLPSEKAGGVLGFTNGGHHRGDDGGHNMNGAVDLGGVIIAEVRDTASDGP